MSKPKESRYAEKLRALGFEPLSEEEEAYIERRIERRMTQAGISPQSLTRRERRLVKKVRSVKQFIVFGGDNPSIHAVDELGKTWKRRGKIDTKKLKILGFVDQTTQAVLVSATAPPLPPDKNH